MKTPKPKPHIVESQVALDEGNSVTSLCGVLIRRSAFIPMGESDYIPGDRMNASQPRGVCQDCLKVKVFRYLAVEAQEALTE
jgi:hypothetical protein